MKNSTIRFDVTLDENHLPQTIRLTTDDGQLNDVKVKSLYISAWDATKKETLRIDLWTKDMPVNEMMIMFHQTLQSMATTLERSTGADKLAGALMDYCDFFATESGIKKVEKS